MNNFLIKLKPEKNWILAGLFIGLLEAFGLYKISHSSLWIVAFVYGSVLSLTNLGLVAYGMNRTLKTQDAKKAFLFSGLLIFKILVLMGLLYAAVSYLNMAVVPLLTGYVSVIFIVVLRLGIRYKPSAL